MLERQIFHLHQQNEQAAQAQQQAVQTQQQLAYTLNVLDHMRGSGVSPSVVMPHIGMTQAVPFMTNRVHLNNNGAAATHEDNQIPLSISGMNGTAYHSSVSANIQPVMTSNPMFSPRQQVVNSRASPTIWQSSQQPGIMNFTPLESNNFAACQCFARHAITGKLPLGRASQHVHAGGRSKFFFANLLQHRGNSSLEDVKREFFPFLLHKMSY